MAKKTDKTADNIQAVEEALSNTELFIVKNQKILSIIIVVIILIVLGVFAFKRLYLAPKETEAQSQMFMAEKYFESDSMNLALYGDGNYLGFLDIIDDYKMTKSANLAKYYAGVAFLNLGDYDQAITFLKKFKGKDEMVSTMAMGATGDAYMELGDKDKALSYYLKAADHKTNEFTTPLFLMKAGLTYEQLGETAKALKLYERIKKDYDKSFEGRGIDKYITRAKSKI